MLQSTEYQIIPYLKWYWRTNNFDRIARRRSLEHTRAAKLLVLAISFGMVVQIFAGLTLLTLGITDNMVGGIEFGAALLISYPVVWAHLIALPLALARLFVSKPKERRSRTKTRKILGGHKATKIAVAGSYGKTTMKELLLTVLGEGKKVAATPANKNVAVSHAQFAKQLKGDEDVVIVEFGEGAPGDVKRFAATTQPDIGIITGLAPAHLDRYKTLRAAGSDIFSLATYLNDKNVYVNGESSELEPFIKPSHNVFTAHGVLDWKISAIKVDPQQTTFTMKKDAQTLNLTTGLIGKHQVGPVALAAALADKLGLTKQQIEEGVAKTVPFEHRMQPRLLGRAWVIDDTYNGNIEGVKVGLELLKELKANRKIYVTPGLVDQGSESKRVHRKIGKLIAAANPDKVVLMKNSVTRWIEEGLKKGEFTGEIKIEEDPVKFYGNLEHLLAAGDVILMQNDWTDNYN